MLTEANRKSLKRSGTAVANSPTSVAARLLALAVFALSAVWVAPPRVAAQTTLEWITPRSGAQAKAKPADECPDDCQEQLAEARAATAAYHNESKALADGFISTVQCVQVPGLGAMGVHYINPARMSDTNVEASQPETLLYIRQGDGQMRLIGMEYYAPVLSNGQPWFGGPNAPPPVIDNPAPVLFGRTFDGPMPGHGPGQHWHYSLHVWAWRHNPRGLFFPFNPKLSC